MNACLPMLVVRTTEATAAIELNGTLMGEASPTAHLVIPLSDSGDYYIGLYPLQDGRKRYFPVMRKLRFEQGVLQSVGSEDVQAFIWPNGIVEAVFPLGILPEAAEIVFPYTIQQLKLPDGCMATLYYENGLRLAIEEGERVRYGVLLGAATTGRLLYAKCGLLVALAGGCRLPEADAPEGYGGLLLALDEKYHEVLRLSGDAVGYEVDSAVVFHRLPTLLGHDKKKKYRYADGAFLEEEEQIGFFTHSPARLDGGYATIRAFCEAVLFELWEEAFSYMTPALREGLDAETIRDCFGSFTGLRAPIPRQENTIGLLYGKQEERIPARIFSFQLEGGLIDNIMEE